MKPETKQFLKELMTGGYRASAIGLSLVLAIVIGFGLGVLMVRWTGWEGWYYIGLIVGIIAGFRNLYIMSRRFQK
ncbi:MAG: AtpZ/AtpI family protein [Deltaproteobacteria bacterium]|nr:AtpZ/AtpI family protein [Deltaproteobacteria bacterium]